MRILYFSAGYPQFNGYPVFYGTRCKWIRDKNSTYYHLNNSIGWYVLLNSKEPFSAADSELERVKQRIMEKQHRIRVCGADEVDSFSANRLTHLITIANPGMVKRPPDWFIGDHLALSFGDVVSEKDARQCNTKAATSDDIRQSIVFFRATRKQQETASLLITCDYGASRSPALAYVLLADQYGGGYESDALNTLLAIRPVAVPNLLVAVLGDQLLRRNGALLATLKEYFSRIIVQT